MTSSGLSSPQETAAIRARADAATPGPWFFAYCAIYSGPKVATDEAWWTEERLNDGHTYDHRSQFPCQPCGGSRCKRVGEALDQDARVAGVTPSYGDTATGQRVIDAEFIAHARTDIPLLLDRLAEAEARTERACEDVQRWMRLGLNEAADRDAAVAESARIREAADKAYEILRATAWRATSDADAIDAALSVLGAAGLDGGDSA